MMSSVFKRGLQESRAARHHLQAPARAAADLKPQVAGLKPPDAGAPLVLRGAADVDAAVKAAQQFAEYHAARAQLLDAVRAARDALGARTREFVGSSAARSVSQ